MTGFNLSEWALRHKSFVVYLMLVFSIAGIASYFALGRDEDPPFTIRTMVVKALWPGATTIEMMQQVTDRLEKKLEELPSLDYVRSYTKPGECVIYVNLRGETPSSDIPDLWYQVRKKVADIRQTLPDGVLGPYFNDEFGDTFGIIYAFTANGFSYRQLRDYVEFVRTELLLVPNVGKIELIGVQDEKIYVEFSTKRLASLGLDLRQIEQALQAQNRVAPAGIIQTDDDRIAMRVSGEFKSEADLRAVNLRANDRFYRLDDIATITRSYSDPPTPFFRFNGEPAIGLAISMAKGGDVLKLGEDVTARMAELEADLPIGIDAHVVSDQPVVVGKSVKAFIKVLLEAVVIVLVVSFLSLGLRAGAVVALCIPLVLVMTFVSMEIFGIDLQRISLGALIISLGLLVDDAMITIEMMMQKLEEGFDRTRAATYAYTATAFPMLTGTLVTVAGFVPIGFAKSGAGEYTFSIFAVVGITLVISWFVAVIFAPLIGITILPEKMTKHAGHGDGRMTRAFRHILIACIRYRWVTIAVTIAIFATSVYGMRFVQQQFFPASDRPEILVDLTLPKGASIKATTEYVDRLEKLLAGDPNVAHWSSYIGQGAIRFYLPLDVQLANDNFAQLVVLAKGLKERDALIAKLRHALAEGFENVIGRVNPLEMGPPVGWPIKYRVSGLDPQEVRRIAYRLADVIRSDPSTTLINYDWNEMSKAIRIEVNQDRATLLGVSTESVSRAINSILTGTRITRLRDSIYLIDVIGRAAPEERADLSTLRDLQIPLDNGRSVSLADVATLDYGLEEPMIWRRQRLPTITVQADLVGDVQPATVVRQLAPQVDELRSTLPAGYSVAVGGTVEESARSRSSVIAGLPMMAFIMVTLLMIQLHSMQRTFLSISVAPLGLIGIVAVLVPTNTPMGFVAILGVIALAGMIIRNSVILIDQIETYIAAGHRPWDAVVDATMHRMRPIILTAAAMVLGMGPICVEIFWGPMAFAIMGGLASATILTLLFLPALYIAWFRIREPEPVAATAGEEAPRPGTHPVPAK